MQAELARLRLRANVLHVDYLHILEQYLRGLVRSHEVIRARIERNQAESRVVDERATELRALEGLNEVKVGDLR